MSPDTSAMMGGFMPRFCPECGTERVADATACSNCNHSFGDATGLPPDGATLSSSVGEDEETVSPPGARRRVYVISGAVALAALVAGGVYYTRGGGLLRPGIVAVDANMIPVSFGGKCGYIDSKGKISINPQFDNALAFLPKFGLAPVVVGGKAGLIDREGKYVVNPQFDDIAAMPDEPEIRVKLGKKWGTIDGTGKFVINPQFDELGEFDRNGRAVASLAGKNGVIDRTGRFVIAPMLDGILTYYAATLRSQTGEQIDYFAYPVQVRQNGQYGFIDATGGFTIPAQFANEEDFDSSGLAAAAIQVTDQAALEQQRRQAAAAAANNAYAADETLMGNDVGVASPPAPPPPPPPPAGPTPTKLAWGYIDKSGKFVISAQFDSAGHFGGSGFAPVQLGTQWGYVDSQGKIAINPQFGSARPFTRAGGEWLSVVSSVPAEGQQAKWGVIDTTGAFRVNPQFDELSDFSPDGRAFAHSGELMGLVDTHGTYVVQPIYQQLIRIHGRSDYIFVKAGEPDDQMREIGVMDSSGRIAFSARGQLCAGIYSYGWGN
jgi:hypothetical protein